MLRGLQMWADAQGERQKGGRGSRDLATTTLCTAETCRAGEGGAQAPARGSLEILSGRTDGCTLSFQERHRPSSPRTCPVPGPRHTDATCRAWERGKSDTPPSPGSFGASRPGTFPARGADGTHGPLSQQHELGDLDVHLNPQGLVLEHVVNLPREKREERGKSKHFLKISWHPGAEKRY